MCIRDRELFDPNYLELIVNNLLSNAFKYTESGQSITEMCIRDRYNTISLKLTRMGKPIPPKIISKETEINSPL